MLLLTSYSNSRRILRYIRVTYRKLQSIYPFFGSEAAFYAYDESCRSIEMSIGKERVLAGANVYYVPDEQEEKVAEASQSELRVEVVVLGDNREVTVSPSCGLIGTAKKWEAFVGEVGEDLENRNWQGIRRLAERVPYLITAKYHKDNYDALDGNPEIVAAYDAAVKISKYITQTSQYTHNSLCYLVETRPNQAIHQANEATLKFLTLITKRTWIIYRAGFSMETMVV